MILSVWAPKPKTVELILNGERHAMREAGHGWWSIDAPGAAPSDRYAFSLDGGPPRPDPRSMDQPDGVRAPSRLVDHAAYRWRAPHFRPPPIASAVIYELHVGTFTPEGTLDAALGRLDHLLDLGVTHVELLPINAFDGDRGWGYDGVGWYAPHRAYTGPDGPDAVKRFVDTCHERGLAVLLDVVYNHLGPSGNYLHEFGPYFTDAYHTPWGAAINLDGPGSDRVRRHIIDNALMWLRDYRFDGLRLDAVHAFHDRSALHLLEQLRVEVDRFQASSGRNVALIAESDLNDPRVVAPRPVGGYGMDAQWSDDFHHALHAFFTGERIGYYSDYGAVADLAKAWRDAFVNDGRYSPFRDRRHGRSPAGLDGSRFLAYAQNHDQVGNRATGDRLSHLLDRRALEAVAALVVLSPFVPIVFQGEEWGAATPFQYFTDHRDEGLARAVREGRRSEFAELVGGAENVPDPQDEGTFQRSTLDWSEPARAEHARLLDWHRRLIHLRRSHPDLIPAPVGAGDVAFSESPPWLRAERGGLTVCVNLGADPQTLPLTDRHARRTIILSNDESASIDGASVRLGPWGVAVLEPEERSVRASAHSPA